MLIGLVRVELVNELLDLLGTQLAVVMRQREDLMAGGLDRT